LSDPPARDKLWRVQHLVLKIRPPSSRALGASDKRFTLGRAGLRGRKILYASMRLGIGSSMAQPVPTWSAKVGKLSGAPSSA